MSFKKPCKDQSERGTDLFLQGVDPIGHGLGVELVPRSSDLFIVQLQKSLDPVRKEGANEALGLFTDLHVVREGDGVLVVHNLLVIRSTRLSA